MQLLKDYGCTNKMEEEYEMEVVIQETPGGFWNIWNGDEKVDSDHFRRASDAQEFCNANNWLIQDIRKHELPRN